MSNIPYNYNQYMDDVTKLRQRGTVSTGEQVKSPNSAGSRGLARVEAFADGPNQLMKANNTDADQELERIKYLAGL